MSKMIHYIGFDVHKDSIAVAIAPQDTAEVRRYGILGGTLEAVDKLVKKISAEEVELRFGIEQSPLPRPTPLDSVALRGFTPLEK